MSGSAFAGPSRTSRAATARNLAAFASRAWKVSVHGTEHMPAEGAVLLASHHTAFLDGFLLAASAPRPVHVLADAELFAPPLDRLLRGTGQIRIDHALPDRAALRAATAILSDGGAVGIFPEVRRGSGDVRHVRHEAAYLATAGAAPVVPVAILGARPSGGGRDALPRVRTPIDVVFGPPVDIRVAGDPRRRVVLARSGERLRQSLADHVQEACRRTGRSLPGPLPLTTQTRSHP